MRNARQQNVSLSVTQAAGAVVRTWMPLRPGDDVTGLFLNVRTRAAESGNDSLCVVELYAGSERPPTVAAARNGDVLIAAETLALVPSNAEPLAAALTSYGLNLDIPLQLRADRDFRFVSLVFTPSTHDLYGFGFLRVRRNGN